MSCPGLHCPGCSSGQSAGIAAALGVGLVVAASAVPWVEARIWWIGGTLAVCFALSVAASMWLEARSDRRGRQWGADRGIYSRADYIAPLPPRVVRAEVLDAPRAELPAAQPVIINVFGHLDADQAEVIRRAIGGR